MNPTCQQIAEIAFGPAERQSGAERFYRCTNHEDRHPSVQVNTRKDCFICGPCGKSGNWWRLAAFAARVDPNDKPAVASWLREHGLAGEPRANGNGRPKPKAREVSDEPKPDFERVAEFRYSPNLRKVRVERPRSNGEKPEKSFRWEHRDGDKWLPGDGGLEKPLYSNEVFKMSEQLSAAIGFEGEAKCDLAGELGLAGFSFKSLAAANCDAFADLEICLWPDYDTSGFKQATDAAKIILDSAQAKSIHIITPPADLPIKGDIVDAVRMLHYSRREIECLIAEAKPYPPEPGPVGYLLDSVTEQKVEWLWDKRIPLGALAILDGDPGVAKSVLSSHVAAKVTRGAVLPGDIAKRSPAGVVVLTAEDSLAHVVVPRLRVADADLSRICAVPYAPTRAGEETFSKLPVDIPVLERAISRVGAKLVIFDVLACYIPITLSMQRDQDVRLALAPLAEMAHRLQVSCLLLRHLNKDVSKSTIYRGGGSIGIVGAARAGLLLAFDPGDPEVRVLACVKSNLGAMADSLSFRVKASDGVPFVEWIGTTQQSAEQLLAPQTAEERGAVQEARDFLRQVLDEGPLEPKQVFKLAAEQGISGAAIKRAKSSVIDTFKVGWHSWRWGLRRSPQEVEG